MLTRIFHKILFSFFLFGYALMRGQNVSYETFNAANGLPTSEIISLCKDYRGFLWVGSILGISKFDGYTFDNFQYSADNYFLGQVNCIQEDHQKRLWIGTNAGLFYHKNNSFYKAVMDDSRPQGVNDILPQPDGSLWLATERGPAYIPATELNVHSPKIDLLKKILPQWPLRVKGQENDRMRASLIRKSTDGTVFIASNTAIYRYLEDSLTCLFNNYDYKTNFQILSIFPVNRNIIYFDEAQESIHKIQNGEVKQIAFAKMYLPEAKPASQPVYYLGTSGVFKFYPEEEIITFYLNTFQAGVAWPSAVLHDSAGIYWLATHDGLYKMKNTPFAKYDIKTFNNRPEIYSFLETSDGKLMMGANRGRLYVQKVNDIIPFFENQRQLFPLAEIFDIHEDKRKWLWFGSGYQGIAVYRHGQLQSFSEEEGLHDNSIQQFLETSNGRFYAVGDVGVSEILVDDAGKISFNKFYSGKRVSQYGTLYGAIEGPDNAIWMGGQEGLFCFKNDSIYPYNLTKRDLYVYDICKDAIGNVWIATSGEGILQCAFDNTNRLLVTNKYTEREGLNTSVFMNLLVDKDDNIWAVSPKGISFIGINGKYKNRVLNFGEDDGFVKSGFFSPVLYQQKNGTIWFGSSNGLCSFSPDNIIVSGLNPRVHITGISLLGGTSLVNSYATSLNEGLPVNLSLPYNKNSINITYTGIDFVGSEGIRYFYRLEGIDTGWIYAKNLRSVSYQNLKPRQYLFKVKAINNKFVWSEKDATFSFAITPPFWQRPWFIGLCILLAAYLLFRLYRFLSQKYETQKILNRFITALYGKNTPEEIFRSIAYNCIHQLGFLDCVVYQVEEERKTLVQKAAAGSKSLDGFEIVNPIEIPVGKGIVGTVAKTGKAEIVPNTSYGNRYIVDDQKRMSEIAVPILVDGVVYGIIDSEHPRKYFYKKHHLYILQTIASICAIRITKYLTEEKLRSKIARDLHDDMGSTLSSINIISKMALQNNESDAMGREYLVRIKESSGRMLESMSDIVWAINPGNDTVEKVILRMKEFAAEILEPLNIGYRFIETGDFGNALLNLNQRKDFYLIFKEAINNAAKYSDCTVVIVELTRSEEAIALYIRDNGRGFDKKSMRSGNGLRNMQSRAVAMKAELKIDAESGHGVSVCLLVPFENKSFVT